ncbi:MAG: hypothetical protein RL701_6083 [Pseudomonadota bacterium]|jgi:3-phosphoshikimate 1-carboxyvinyltransferase
MSESDAVRVVGGRALRGVAQLGPDNHVLECALALSALAHGTSQLQGALASEQLTVTLGAWTALGATCQCEGGVISVQGAGFDALSAPRGALDAGGSVHLLAQLAGVLSAQTFGTRVTMQQAGLREPPVEHIVGVLRARGGQIAGKTSATDSERIVAPIAVAPLLDGERLQAIDATLPFADSATKAALLLSGLYAAGPTTLSEPHVSADGLERLLVALGLPLRRIGSIVAFDPSAWDQRLPGLGTVRLPGSAVLAAHIAVLAQWLPGSDVTLRCVSVNPSQSGVLDVLRSWGAPITWQHLGDAAMREPIADIRVGSAQVRGGVLDAELVVRAGAALPALALLGPIAARGVRLYDLGSLAACDDPEWLRIDPVLGAFGFASERAAMELAIPRAVPAGVPPDLRRENEVDAQGDAALALLGCTLALASHGETVVQHAARALRAIHPGFVSALQQLGASIEYA